jgi:hypothetical protein
VVDRAQHVLTSSDPTGGASAWQRSNLPADQRFAPEPRASCPSAQLCVVTEGHVWASTDPSGGASAWEVQSPLPPAGWRAVECSSPTLCVVSKADVFQSSTNPSGGVSAWGADGLDPNGAIVSISCRPGTARCVAVDNQGGELSSEHPALPQR